MFSLAGGILQVLTLGNTWQITKVNIFVRCWAWQLASPMKLCSFQFASKRACHKDMETLGRVYSLRTEASGFISAQVLLNVAHAPSCHGLFPPFSALNKTTGLYIWSGAGKARKTRRVLITENNHDNGKTEAFGIMGYLLDKNI